MVKTVEAMVPEGESTDAIEIAKLIVDEFKGRSETVSVEQLAALYGVMALNIEATSALYQMMISETPGLILHDQEVRARKSSLAAFRAWREGIMDLARSYGNTEGPGAKKDE